MKSRQFCSVCKQWLEMEVVPTGDGDDDDGVIWFRCPQCQGFLPKLSGEAAGQDEGAGPVGESTPANDPAAGARGSGADDEMPWDSPADMMAARKAGQTGSVFLPEEDDEAADADLDPDLDPDLLLPDLGADLDADDLDDPDDGDDADEDDDRPQPRRPQAPAKAASEPVHEYAALLAGLDAAAAVPYRPWETFEIGQCVHHVAWGECGVVVGKESLPGGRRVIKCYFEAAGVVRLIEQAEP